MSTRLMSKPSDLLEQGIRCLEEVEHDPRYQVMMTVWHGGNGFNGAADCPCYVNLAGAVMAVACAIPIETTVSIDNEFRYGWAEGPNWLKFKALAAFGTFNIELALIELGVVGAGTDAFWTELLQRLCKVITPRYVGERLVTAVHRNFEGALMTPQSDPRKSMFFYGQNPVMFKNNMQTIAAVLRECNL